MKTYPSIVRGCIQHFRAHIFDKVDGSNLRFEFSKKRGWYKYGTRNHLFDQTDPIFGQAIEVFHNNGLAQGIADIAKAQRWDKVVAFAEFYGPHSFAGVHQADDPKSLTLFDVSPLRKGILPPVEFLKLFGHLDIAKFLGTVDWNHDYVARVKRNEVEGVTFEGVVAKGTINKELIMEKAKTQIWIDKVYVLHEKWRAQEIVES